MGGNCVTKICTANVKMLFKQGEKKNTKNILMKFQGMHNVPVPLVVPSPMVLINSYEFFLVPRPFVVTQIERTLRVTCSEKAVISTDGRHKVSLQSLAIKLVVVLWWCESLNNFYCCWGVRKPFVRGQLSQVPAPIEVSPNFPPNSTVFCFRRQKKKLIEKVSLKKHHLLKTEYGR